jgi:hypothetical protein
VTTTPGLIVTTASGLWRFLLLSEKAGQQALESTEQSGGGERGGQAAVRAAASSAVRPRSLAMAIGSM